MREQSGRSLIEIIGVLAIGAVMVAATYSAYHSTNKTQKRFVASETLKDIAQKTKTLLEYTGYTPVSVSYLVEAGALDNEKSPLGGNDWSITSNFDGSEFSINLTDLTFDECVYFTTKKFDWTTRLVVNGYDSSSSSFCMRSGANKISFFAK